MKYIITLALIFSVNLALASTIDGRVIGVTDAMKQGEGLWKQPDPITPWDFRRARR